MNVSFTNISFIQNNADTQNKRTLPQIQSPKLAPLMFDTVSFLGRNKKTTPKLEDLAPSHKGTIYKKIRNKNGKVIRKVPVEVDIEKEGAGDFRFKIDDEIIGYVQLKHIPAKMCNKNEWDELFKNYKEEGIEGDRIEVHYLKNEKEEEYGGIGHLADLVEVACCKEMGFKPNVISYAALDASPMHYMRGKRFIPYERYCSLDEIEQYDLKDKTPNDTVKEIIKNTPKGKKFDTSELEMFLVMYMPEEMIKKLEEELKKHPIF